MDLTHLASNLELRANGIYYPKESKDVISYPSVGNENCYQIEENSFWFQHRNKVIIDAVKKYSSGKLFFDVGGGNGFVSKELAGAGIETVLVEPGNGALNAKRGGLKNVVCATLQEAGFVKGSIEAIGLFDVVEHIPDDEAFLSDISQSLAPGGYVFITVPAYQFLWSGEDDYTGHCRRYTTAGMKEKLKKSGFDIIFDSYIFSILPLPVFFTRSLPSKLGFNLHSENLEKHIREHNKNKGWITSLMNKVWNWERQRLLDGRRIPFGGSCFLIARKR